MVYKWYLLPIGGIYANYHLLPEPDKSADIVGGFNPNTPSKTNMEYMESRNEGSFEDALVPNQKG